MFLENLLKTKRKFRSSLQGSQRKQGIFFWTASYLFAAKSSGLLYYCQPMRTEYRHGWLDRPTILPILGFIIITRYLLFFFIILSIKNPVPYKARDFLCYGAGQKFSSMHRMVQMFSFFPLSERGDPSCHMQTHAEHPFPATPRPIPTPSIFWTAVTVSRWIWIP